MIILHPMTHTDKTPLRFLVIRFRQMGDAVLATSLLNAIKLNFPGSQTHFVLNDKLAPLFAGHPAVDEIITFTDDERHAPLRYLAKIWKVMRRGKYDVIIDMRSTVNTLPFSLFSPFSRYRIGLKKSYTRFLLNKRVTECDAVTDVVTHDLGLLRPLQGLKPLNLDAPVSLHITPEELHRYREFLKSCGVDLTRPLLLCGVVSKLAHKTWPRDYMVAVLRKVIETYPDLQIVFNYAPGVEESEARLIYKELRSPGNVFINVKAASMRELVALATCSRCYFGNEGGARHICHAVGIPSLVVVSPNVNKKNWLPSSGPEAEGIAVSDVLPPERMAQLDYSAQYRSISPDYVLERLLSFLNRHLG